MKIQKILTMLFILITGALTVFFCYEKYRLGLIRYFDVDEFAYLNFTNQMLSGARIYKDVAFGAPPGYLFFLSPIVKNVSGAVILTAIRQAAFVVFLFLCGSLAFLFWQARKSWWFIVAPLFLVSLALPSDKFLESRPDTLMMALFTLGVAFQIRAFHKTRFAESLFSFFLSGFFYSASVFVLQKTLLLLPWSIVMALIFLFYWGKQRSWKQSVSRLLVFGFGLSIFLWILLLFAIRQNTIGNLWYYLVDFVKESNVLAVLYPIPPEFIFQPNDVYYGLAGIHIGYILNTILWVGAVMLAISYFFMALFKHRGARLFTDLLLNGFLIYSMGIYWFYPAMKHPQYLIPASVFVALVWSDTVYTLWNALRKRLNGTLIFSVLYFMALFFLFRGVQTVNRPKFYWSNWFDKEMLSSLLKRIPKDEYVFDLVGLAYFYPQPYIFCCVPFGQFQDYLSRPFPSLKDALIRTNTKYVYQGVNGRIATLLEEDFQYISGYFTKVGSGALMVRNDIAYEFKDFSP